MIVTTFNDSLAALDRAHGIEYLECEHEVCRYLDVESADGVLSPVVDTAEVERWRTPHSRINSC